MCITIKETKEETMKKLNKLFLTLVLIMSTSVTILLAQEANSYGYYKDIFMDSGIMLTSRKDLPASRYLNLSIEAFVSAANTEESPLTLRDTLLQRECICGNAMDLNGILLYPDGQPRFRMIYMNGGKATKHGISLTQTGINNIQKFVNNGGSYVGTCAGAFIASAGINKDKDNELPHKGYLSIWPGIAHNTGLIKNYTGMFVEKNSPLLKYYDFGGDMHIDSVRHNGGCYADYSRTMPEETEVLLRYDYDTIPANSKIKIHNEVSAWAYKKDNNSGRIVAIGSHPEGVVYGERLDLMSAMIRYAMEGNANPKVKGMLEEGIVREMKKSTLDNDPLFTKIGDRQYHHFTINVPKKVSKMIIELKGYKDSDNFDLSLFANNDDYAFHHNAKWKNVSLGCYKTIEIDNPAQGEWYLSVFCETTVDSQFGEYGTEYSGRTDVLNGVPYNIKIIFN
jgi:Uncharacterized conserved protein